MAKSLRDRVDNRKATEEQDSKGKAPEKKISGARALINAAIEQDKALENAKTTKGKKVGRPKTKTEPTKTINIAVPLSVLEKMDKAKVCHKNNLTQYVNDVIAADLEKNFDKYKEICDSLNDMK
jgi:Cdc6-like AAA superfamily ATPase